MPHRLPRVFLCRHGETEWSLSGQHTGKTDIPLTSNGVATLSKLSKEVMGPGKLLCPNTISHIFVSPRQRAQKTYEILTSGLSEQDQQKMRERMETCEGIQEWDYGDFEGKTSQQIRSIAGKEQWDIYNDGCPNGESVVEMTDRVDAIIQRIREIHQTFWDKTVQNPEAVYEPCGDVMLVTHGHFSKCFLTRWCRLPLKNGNVFVVDAGGISVCGYQHQSLDEPSLLAMNLYAL